jgi:hypothetical protein
MTERGREYIKKHNLDVLVRIDDGTLIYATKKADYICFVSDLDICNDGSGPSHGDPSYQSETAYYNGGKFLNADKDFYIVIPPQVRSMIKPVVMGCQAKLTIMDSMKNHDAVTGEIGPHDITGEAAYCLAKFINPRISHNTGDDRRLYFYELWPGKAAVVNGKTYALEPA